MTLVVVSCFIFQIEGQFYPYFPIRYIGNSGQSPSLGPPVGITKLYSRNPKIKIVYIPHPYAKMNSGSNNMISDEPQISDNYQPSATQQMASDIGNFSDALYQALLTDSDENIIFSPFSVQTALSMLACGAQGNTATEMQNALRLGNLTTKSIASNFDTLLTPFQSNSILHIANAIYVMKGYDIRPSYQTIVEQKFYSQICSINFANSQKAANTINEFVEQETHDKIKNLVSAQDFNQRSRLALINAIYFNGTWQHKFTPAASKLPFYTNGCGSNAKSVQQTQMMKVSV